MDIISDPSITIPCPRAATQAPHALHLRLRILQRGAQLRGVALHLAIAARAQPVQNENPWNPVGKPLKTMENYGKSVKINGKSWRIVENQ